MLTKINTFVKTYKADIILAIGVMLISLFSFAVGYLFAREQFTQSIIIEQIPYEQQK